MKLTGTLIRMEEKRTLKILPQYFLGVFLLTALIGVVVMFSVLATEKDVTKQDMTVALVLHDNDFLRTFGLDVLESSSSVEDLCTFIETDEEDAMGIPVLWVINNEEVNPPWGKVTRIKSDERIF